MEVRGKMRMNKELLVRIIGRRARRRVAELSHEMVRAPSWKKEQVLAEIEFERWLAETCEDCQSGSRAASSESESGSDFSNLFP